MAEEMAEAIAENAKSNSSNPGGGIPRLVSKSASNDGLRNKAVEPGLQGERNEAQGEVGQESAPSNAPVNFSSRMRKFLEEHFDEILNGVLKGIKEGNISGAKLLLDHCNLKVAGSDQENFEAAGCLRLADVFGDLDWERLPHAQAPASNGVVEHAVDSGPGGVETD
jgi:hypothetical protein